MAAFALGTNVWVSIVILPAFFLGSLHGAGHVLAALLPFAVLPLGLRRASECGLLGRFPAAVSVPSSIQPHLPSTRVSGPLSSRLSPSRVPSAPLVAAPTSFTAILAFFTLSHEAPPGRSPTVTFTPESVRFCACACPCEPYPMMVTFLPLTSERSASLS